jgi:hypothetical protein
MREPPAPDESERRGFRTLARVWIGSVSVRAFRCSPDPVSLHLATRPVAWLAPSGACELRPVNSQPAYRLRTSGKLPRKASFSQGDVSSRAGRSAVDVCQYDTLRSEESQACGETLYVFLLQRLTRRVQVDAETGFRYLRLIRSCGSELQLCNNFNSQFLGNFPLVFHEKRAVLHVGLWRTPVVRHARCETLRASNVRRSRTSCEAREPRCSNG